MTQPHVGARELLVDQGTAGIFQLTLSLVRTEKAEASLLLHSTAYVEQIQRTQLTDFYRQFGFIHFDGSCPYYVKNCYYIVIGSMSLYYPSAEQKHPILSNLSNIAQLLNENFYSSGAQAGDLERLIGVRDNVWNS